LVCALSFNIAARTRLVFSVLYDFVAGFAYATGRLRFHTHARGVSSPHTSLPLCALCTRDGSDSTVCRDALCSLFYVSRSRRSSFSLRALIAGFLEWVWFSARHSFIAHLRSQFARVSNGSFAHARVWFSTRIGSRTFNSGFPHTSRLHAVALRDFAHTLHLTHLTQSHPFAPNLHFHLVVSSVPHCIL